MNESEFLRGLTGKAVRITAVDEQYLPPLKAMTLQEVTTLGIVLDDGHTQRFFPWHEIVELHPAGERES